MCSLMSCVYLICGFHTLHSMILPDSPVLIGPPCGTNCVEPSDNNQPLYIFSRKIKQSRSLSLAHSRRAPQLPPPPLPLPPPRPSLPSHVKAALTSTPHHVSRTELLRHPRPWRGYPRCSRRGWSGLRGQAYVLRWIRRIRVQDRPRVPGTKQEKKRKFWPVYEECRFTSLLDVCAPTSAEYTRDSLK